MKITCKNPIGQKYPRFGITIGLLEQPVVCIQFFRNGTWKSLSNGDIVSRSNVDVCKKGFTITMTQE